MFEIEGKVALVTGGASGIGLSVSRKLLENGAKGVTIADINSDFGEQAAEKLRKQFGEKRIIFRKTDVSNKNSLEESFKETLVTFNHIDILVNNAGIVDDKNYDREIDINLKGVVHGTTLGIQKYLTNYKSGPEGVIVNVASVAGTAVHPALPIYSATKSAVVRLTMTMGNEVNYERTKVRVVAIAPGYTESNIFVNMPLKEMGLDNGFGEMLEDLVAQMIPQSSEIVGENVMKIIKEKPSGSVWISEDSKEIFEYRLSQTT